MVILLRYLKVFALCYGIHKEISFRSTRSPRLEDEVEKCIGVMPPLLRILTSLTVFVIRWLCANVYSRDLVRVIAASNLNWVKKLNLCDVTLSGTYWELSTRRLSTVSFSVSTFWFVKNHREQHHNLPGFVDDHRAEHLDNVKDEAIFSQTF